MGRKDIDEFGKKNMEEEKRLKTKKLHVGITTLGSEQGVMRHRHP